MAITTGVTTTGKLAFLSAALKRPCKLALYTSAANVGPDTKRYTPHGECTGEGYRAGGISLKGCRVWEDNGSACLTWETPTFGNVTVCAAGFMIYYADTGESVFVGSYGGEYSSSNGPFVANLAADTIVFS